MLKQILTCLKEHVSELYSVFPIPMLQNWGKRRACIDSLPSSVSGSNDSGGKHCASSKRMLGTWFYSVFSNVQELRTACFSTRRVSQKPCSAGRIVSSRNLCASSLGAQIANGIAAISKRRELKYFAECQRNRNQKSPLNLRNRGSESLLKWQ